MTEYQDIADALKREYGHQFTANGETRYDFSKHVYVGRAGALLLKADRADASAKTLHEQLRIAVAHIRALTGALDDLVSLGATVAICGTEYDEAAANKALGGACGYPYCGGNSPECATCER